MVWVLQMVVVATFFLPAMAYEVDKLWRLVHGQQICGQAGKASSTSPRMPSECANVPRGARVVVSRPEVDRGLINQFGGAAYALREACKRGSLLASTIHTDLNKRGAPDLDLQEFLQLPHSTKGFAIKDCNATLLVPRKCVSEKQLRVILNTVFPKLPFLNDELLAMPPRIDVPWHPTRCSFHRRKESYNVAHLNFDMDWIANQCFRAQPNWLNSENAPELRALFDAHGPFRGVVMEELEQFVKDMDGFREKKLPIVVCASVGKVFDETRWIGRELERIVHERTNTSIVFGARTDSYRETNALADLQMMLGGRELLYWYGSTFSRYALMHRVRMNHSSIRHTPLGSTVCAQILGKQYQGLKDVIRNASARPPTKIKMPRL